MIKRTQLTAEKALQRLEDLCARSEQCQGEAREKLRRWGISAPDCDKIIQSLVDNRYIDDRRYVQAFVNDKVKFSRWGRRKILQALIQKRIDRELISEALENIDIEEYMSNIIHVARCKINSSPQLAGSYEGRTKIYRHLLSRGFEPDLAAKALKTALHNNTD